MTRQQVERRTHAYRRRAVEEVETTERPQAPRDVRHEMDEILDEIDQLLEANAEEFVNAYVQKGGE